MRGSFEHGSRGLDDAKASEEEDLFKGRLIAGYWLCVMRFVPELLGQAV